MRTYYVYKHTTPSQKVYIGITKQEPEKRWKNGKGYDKDQIFRFAIEKYGWANIKHEILFEGLTEEEACEKEVELIAFYKSADRRYGYNISLGGNTSSPTEEENAKRSNSMTKNWSDPEYRKRISESMRGVKRSEESRQNISIAQKKRFERPEERKATSERQIGKRRSEEAKRKTSETLRAYYSLEENHKKQAELHRESNRKTHGKKVRCIETGKVYEVISDASKEMGIERRNISAVCRHKRKSVCGYTWEYVI